MPLSTRYRNDIIDICCRIISDDNVLLEERIWMNKLCDVNTSARKLRDDLLAVLGDRKFTDRNNEM
tara:strand:- start:617 stop:814 length:198 start_codon:yes stop_codon:yes gene_type:complete